MANSDLAESDHTVACDFTFSRILAEVADRSAAALLGRLGLINELATRDHADFVIALFRRFARTIRQIRGETASRLANALSANFVEPDSAIVVRQTVRINRLDRHERGATPTSPTGDEKAKDEKRRQQPELRHGFPSIRLAIRCAKKNSPRPTILVENELFIPE
jgi:hypothetical protein